MEYKEYLEEIDLRKYLLILKQHWLPGTAVWSIAVIIAIFVGFSKKPMYEAYGKLRFKKQNTTYALVTEAGEKLGKLDSLNSKDSPLDTEVEVIRSEPVVNQTIAKLNLKSQGGKVLEYEDFLKNLKLETIRGTDILKVSYKSRNPKEAFNVVDTLMKVYIAKNILSNQAEAAAAQGFIKTQLPQTENRLRKTEVLLRTFKEQNNIVNLEQETKATVAAIVDIDQQINLTQVEIEKTTGRAIDIQQKIGMNSQEALAKSSLSQSLAVRQVFEQLKQVENQLAVERTQLLNDNPRIINLKEKEVALNALLKERVKQTVGEQNQLLYKNLQINNGNQTGNVQQNLTETLINTEAERKALVKKLASLIKIRSNYKQRVSSLPRLEQRQQELQQQVSAAQSSYELILKNREQLRLAENQNLANAQIVSPAIAPKLPIPANKKIILGVGIAGGSLLFVITAFLLELANPSIKTTKEVRNIFRYKLLAMIPSSKKKAPLLRLNTKWTQPEHQVRNLPFSTISQTYRMLQTQLNWSTQEQNLKVIVVTSSMPKEGKSTVSANLAMTFAQLESRVLLIDADLYNPRQHQVWNLTNEVGLSDLIVSLDDLNKAVKQVMPNLDVLTSGAMPPNSFSMLGSEQMDSLIQFFSKTYDFIIIDTPPFLLIPDALTLSKMSDGMLLVVRPGVIDKASANAAKELLEQSNQNVLGIVVNGITSESGSYSYNGKGYANLNSQRDPNYLLKE